MFFYPPADGGNPAGHVGIALGGGQMVSTLDAGSELGVWNTTITWAGTMAGWSMPSDGWPGRPDLAGPTAPPVPTPTATPRPPTTATPVAAVDWRNTEYSSTCGGLVSQAFKVAVRNGVGQSTGSGSASGGWDSYQIQVQAVVAGALTGAGSADDAVLPDCAPQPSNFFSTEVQVFGASGQRIDVLLPQSTPGAPLTPVFDSRGLSVSDGGLVTVVDRYGPGDSHASGPSIRQTVTWRWNGQHFVVTSVQ